VKAFMGKKDSLMLNAVILIIL